MAIWLRLTLALLLCSQGSVQSQEPQKPTKTRTYVRGLLETAHRWTLLLRENGRAGRLEPDASDLRTTCWLLTITLADGSTSGSGPHERQIRSMLSWVLDQQDARGRFGHSEDPGWHVQHAHAASLLAWNAAQTGRRSLAAVADKAIPDLLRWMRGLGAETPEECLFWSSVLADQLLRAEVAFRPDQNPYAVTPWISSARVLMREIDRILEQRLAVESWTPILSVLAVHRGDRRWAADPDPRMVEPFRSCALTIREGRAPTTTSQFASLIGFHGHAHDRQSAKDLGLKTHQVLRGLVEQHGAHPLAGSFIQGERPALEDLGLRDEQIPESVRDYAIQTLGLMEYYRYSSFPLSSFAGR